VLSELGGVTNRQIGNRNIEAPVRTHNAGRDARHYDRARV
jgi:hypothetical protein